MSVDTQVQRRGGESRGGGAAAADPCVLVIFGASGDLTRRLLMPALYNMARDGLLPERFAVLGTARAEATTEEFRGRMAEALRTFHTSETFDQRVADGLVGRLHYAVGDPADAAAMGKLAARIAALDAEVGTGGNVLFYMALPPAVFGVISENLARAGLTRRERGWARVIVEKPFGHDLASAEALNRSLLAHWAEDQVYRIDHYLGKETVQNLLAFRFANGIFEPLWNKNHIDHVQFTVSETVGVEGRGRYYEGTGVLRDMIQNHMFQMLAYLGMEPPGSFRPEAVRDEKAKLLGAVRVWRPEEVARNAVRGQYGPGRKADGSPAAGYREEPNVGPRSRTETFAALRLFIDNWRWEGVPFYLRSGKATWRRGTEVVVQFKKAPEVIFRGTPAAGGLDANRLLFHVQPDQRIELRFHAKTPGPSLRLQRVNMRFDYKEAFESGRGTGYEVLLYGCMTGDSTLFSRTDLVETAWRIAQPVLDAWAADEAPAFPDYPAGSWGPKSAFELMERDGRNWVEVVNRDMLCQVPLFCSCGPVFLQTLAMMLRPVAYGPGDVIIRQGDVGREMYVIARGRVEVLDGAGRQLRELRDGEFFGELSLLASEPRSASVRAVSACDLFVLDQRDFNDVLHSHPQFAASLHEAARSRYQAKVGV
jgi:glucose-6-phosphate 1-dehydrogenase